MTGGPTIWGARAAAPPTNTTGPALLTAATKFTGQAWSLLSFAIKPSQLK